jgi:hypothetical protein
MKIEVVLLGKLLKGSPLNWEGLNISFELIRQFYKSFYSLVIAYSHIKRKFLVKMMAQVKGSKGQMVNAEQLSFKPISEGFNEYELSDGNKLKIRIILSEIFKLDEKDEMTGRNNYFIKSAPIMSIEELKK